MKNPLFRGGSQKTNIEGGDCLKRGAWTVCRFKGEEGLRKKEGSVLRRGRYPYAHYVPPGLHYSRMLIGSRRNNAIHLGKSRPVNVMFGLW